jgi:hypothetical protein
MGRPFKFSLGQAVMDWNELGMCSGYRKCVQGIENFVKHKFNYLNLHVLNSINKKRINKNLLDIQYYPDLHFQKIDKYSDRQFD